MSTAEHRPEGFDNSETHASCKWGNFEKTSGLKHNTVRIALQDNKSGSTLKTHLDIFVVVRQSENNLLILFV